MTAGVAAGRIPTRRSGRRPLLLAAGAAAALLLVCFVVYLALELLPGDAASQRFGMSGSPAAVAQARAAWGLDQPVLLRFAQWVGGLLRGDLGTTYATGGPVGALLATPLARTSILLGVAALGVTLLGVGGGIVAGVRAGGVLDRMLGSAALAIISMPEFIVGTLLVLLFAGTLGWLPAVSLVSAGSAGVGTPVLYVLPALAVILVASAPLLRRVRAVVREQSALPHVEAAMLAGQTPVVVVVRHLLPGATAPILQAGAATVPYLLGGAVVLERLFAFPGLGSLLIDAVGDRESAVVMACVLLMTGASLAAFAAADALTGRVR